MIVHMSHIMRKPTDCIYAKTNAQTSFAVTAKLIILISTFVFTARIVQFLYFLNLSKISNLLQSSVLAQLGLCQTWSETKKLACRGSSHWLSRDDQTEDNKVDEINKLELGVN